MKRVNLAKVKHTARDGRLLATSFEVSVCKDCTGVHMDLLDDDGDVFATAIFPIDMVLPLAERLCAFEEHLQGRKK